jgi:murein tripeptide amidase MpaA
MDWKYLSFFLLVSVVCVVADDFRGWKVVRATIAKKEDIEEINTWNLDVWSYESNLVLGLNDMRVTAEHIERLNNMGIQYSILVDDVQMMLDEMAKEYVNETAADWFASYHTYDEITAFYANLSITYPTLVKKTTIGQSIQGRNIDAIVITGTATGAKKKVLYTAMQHAREWISPHTVAYVVNQLVTLYSTDSSVKAILDGIVFHVVPIVNPDG